MHCIQLWSVLVHSVIAISQRVMLVWAHQNQEMRFSTEKVHLQDYLALRCAASLENYTVLIKKATHHIKIIIVYRVDAIFVFFSRQSSGCTYLTWVCIHLHMLSTWHINIQLGILLKWRLSVYFPCNISLLLCYTSPWRFISTATQYPDHKNQTLISAIE